LFALKGVFAKIKKIIYYECQKPQMASIPGVLFIVVGLLVSASSLYINIIQKSNSMLLFAVIGGFLVLWGIIKRLFMEKKDKH